MLSPVCSDRAVLSTSVVQSESRLPQGASEYNQADFSEARLTARWVSARDADASLKRQWRALERAALEPNVFLSADFVLPAVEHLSPGEDVQLMLIESSTTQDDRSLVGLGAFTVQEGDRRFPFRHLKSYMTPHTFLTGLLIDRSCVENSLAAFWELIQSDHHCHGVQFDCRSSQTAFSSMLEQSSRRVGIKWSEEWGHERAVLVPSTLPDDYVSTLSKNRRKSLRKSQRELEVLGPVSFRIVRPTSDCDAYATVFLDLEDSGWKSGNGTSLLQSDADSQWFMEAVASFASHRNAVFCELRSGSTPIASTVNFASGDELFAFKVGWENSLAGYSPGTLNELQTILNARGEWSDFRQVDSCASQGSFIEKLWAGRRAVTTGYFATSRRSRVWRAGLDAARGMKQRLRQ